MKDKITKPTFQFRKEQDSFVTIYNKEGEKIGTTEEDQFFIMDPEKIIFLDSNQKKVKLYSSTAEAITYWNFRNGPFLLEEIKEKNQSLKEKNLFLIPYHLHEKPCLCLYDKTTKERVAIFDQIYLYDEYGQYFKQLGLIKGTWNFNHKEYMMYFNQKGISTNQIYRVTEEGIKTFPIDCENALEARRKFEQTQKQQHEENQVKQRETQKIYHKIILSSLKTK